MKIGIVIDNLKLGFREGIIAAASMKVDGIQFFAVSGETAPENLSVKARREILSYINDYGLQISALCGDMGGHAFADKEDNISRIEYSKRVMELALDLGVNIVTTHLNMIPSDPNHERYKILQDACNALGNIASSDGGCFAIETGMEKAITMRKFLNDLDTESIKVNYDPANLVMVADDDAVEGVRVLEKYIVHTHAKDGVRNIPGDIEELYEKHLKGIQITTGTEKIFEERLLGKGNVNFEKYLKALTDIGYDGYLTIEHETEDDSVDEIRKEVEYLRKLINGGDLVG